MQWTTAEATLTLVSGSGPPNFRSIRLGLTLTLTLGLGLGLGGGLTLTLGGGLTLTLTLGGGLTLTLTLPEVGWARIRHKSRNFSNRLHLHEA